MTVPPTRRGVVRPGRRRGQTPRAPGQILVLFAIFSTALFGVLGLAVDLGFAFSERRTMQNAADAAALAGARAVARWTALQQTNPYAEAEQLAEKEAGNAISALSGQELVSCEFVRYLNGSDDDDDDDDSGGLGPCNVPLVPAAATGVRVRVRETHPTFFIRAVPGAPNSISTEAVATAHVQMLAKYPSDGPFIVCGTHAWALKNAAGTTLKAGKGDTVPLLLETDDDEYEINPLYVGYTFRVWDNKLSQGNQSSPAYLAGCGTKEFDGGADWNGNAKDEGDGNVGKSAPGWFGYDNGTKVGPVNSTVLGIQGCRKDQAEPYNCVMYLPLARAKADDDPNSQRNNLYVVGFAAFYVEGENCNNNGVCQEFNGRLLDDFITLGAGSNTWCRTCVGSVVIRLTE